MGNLPHVENPHRWPAQTPTNFAPRLAMARSKGEQLRSPSHRPATLDAATWDRLSPLLDAALDQPPTERAAGLADLQVRAPQDA